MGFVADDLRTRPLRVGLLWRAEWDPFEPGVSSAGDAKLHGMFDAFAALGVEADPVVYSDENIDAIRAQLLELDGVLVWVNPIEQGLDRSKLDPLLREVAIAGVWVSAHPDVILRLATKEVLVETKNMSWGTDTRLYRNLDELRDALPDRLATGPRVLKQHRGMGGHGVWKVESLRGRDVLVQHAAAANAPERMLLDEFLGRCETYFDGGGPMVDQPFQDRLPEGMIRVYLSQVEVVGYTHQYPRGLMPPGADDRPWEKRWEPVSEPRYQSLRERVESNGSPSSNG